MNIRSFYVGFLSLAVVTAFALSCNQNKGEGAGNGNNKKAQQGKKAGEVTMYYANWPENIAMTKVAKVALEEVGYTVNDIMAGPGMIYASLSKGDGDAFLESWLPQTHAKYWEKYGDKLQKMGTSFNNASTGLVVPSYVSINSIEELNAHAGKFDDKIIGIGSGAGIHKDTKSAIKAYNLDFKQITSSGPAMLASLKKAVNANEWIVVTGWKPHHKWAMYDLKYLEDPKNVYPKEKAYILARQGLDKDKPLFAEFLRNFHFKEDLLYEMMLEFEKADEMSAARTFYENHKAMIRSWMPDKMKQ